MFRADLDYVTITKNASSHQNISFFLNSPSPPVLIYGVDEYDNKTNIQGTVSVSIETENGERNAKSMPELDRQCLSFRMRGSLV